MRRCNDIYEIVTVYYPTGCVNTTSTPTSTTTTTLPPTTTTTSSSTSTSTSTSTSSTTTSTTTSLPNIPCNVSYSSGGSGVTEYSIPLDPLGGVIVFQFSARNTPDKMEILHNNVKKSTSGMLADGNSGPFDAYGEPPTNLPTIAQTYDINQFIGRNRTSPVVIYKNIQPIPSRKTELLAATGFDLTLTGSYDQFVWWTYTPSDYIINNNVIIRVTGPSGNLTGWDLQRLCPAPPTTTTTTTTVNPCPDCVAHDVTIGTQIWTGCNLDVTTYANGDPIPEVTDPTDWANLTTGAWCYYNNDSVNGTTYGKLYNWYAVNDPRGLAPAGYHVPTEIELNTLSTYLGGDSIAGGKMKEVGLCHWDAPNSDATNNSGFTGLPGGYRYISSFINIKQHGAWWCSINVNVNDGFSFLLYNNVSYLDKGTNNKKNGFSVRLIKD